MSGYSVKVYLVQRASGEVIAAKAAFGPAHAIAKAHAPAQVLFAVADKTDTLNVLDYDPNQKQCNQLQSGK